jgi:hypothetical protein
MEELGFDFLLPSFRVDLPQACTMHTGKQTLDDLVQLYTVKEQNAQASYLRVPTPA